MTTVEEMNRIASTNAALDALNASLEEAEDFFVGLGFGVPAHVKLSNDYTLYFGRMKGDWILYVSDAVGNVQSLIGGANKQLRIESASMLRPLYAALLITASRHVSEVEEATRRVNAFLMDVKP